MKLTQIQNLIVVALELGPAQVALNLAYKIGLKLQLYAQMRYNTSVPGHISAIDPASGNTLNKAILTLLTPTAKARILDRADKICQGSYEQFGLEGSPIALRPPNNKTHWVDLEQDQKKSGQEQDIKLIWEPARFGWGLQLAQAYNLTHNSIYVENFHQKLNQFIDENPAGFGENWQSAQECAIRIINILFASHLFGDFPNLPWHGALSLLIETHAVRITQTLAYAQSQNNNHYLSESIALITCAKALPVHPKAVTWYKTGWRGVRWCLQNQFEQDGEYVQHSTNYHRLVLQLLLWVHCIDPNGFTSEDLTVIKNATIWYANISEPRTGLAPNLGANDGAYLFPISCLPFEDHRPIAQACLQIFCGATLPAGIWDDMLAWMGVLPNNNLIPFTPSPRLSIADPTWRLFLRAIRYRNRPSHADHLHCDVWAYGRPIALDAGTFSYNNPSPWQNGLADTNVHNAVTVDGRGQMERVSKFLFTKWSTSTATVASDGTIKGIFQSRTKVAYTHYREVSNVNGHFFVRDSVESRIKGKPRRFRLHWLLADLDWQWQVGSEICLTAQYGDLRYFVQIEPYTPSFEYRITRAGINLDGSLPAEVVDGWFSPTYLQKIPAVSVAVEGVGQEYSFSTQFWATPIQE